MNERKKKMMETALALFAKKGYSATSIQEITEAWGISKGAFYNNFSSKEELMLSIMKYYTDLAIQQVQSVPEVENEKETFIEQICIQFSIIDSHKEFISMRLAEHLQQVSEEIRQYFFETRVKMFKWYMMRLLKVFGMKIEPYLLDCVVLMLSMIHGYASLMILDQKPLDFEKTSRFLVKRLESIINGLTDEAPLLTKKNMKEFLQIDEQLYHVQSRVNALRHKVPASAENILASLDALDREFASGGPRPFMAESLLLYLKKQCMDEWKHDLGALEKAVYHYFSLHTNQSELITKKKN